MLVKCGVWNYNEPDETHGLRITISQYFSINSLIAHTQ